MAPIMQEKADISQLVKQANQTKFRSWYSGLRVNFLFVCLFVYFTLTYHYIEVTVDHDRTPAPEVDVLLPPVTNLQIR